MLRGTTARAPVWSTIAARHTLQVISRVLEKRGASGFRSIGGHHHSNLPIIQQSERLAVARSGANECVRVNIARESRARPAPPAAGGRRPGSRAPAGRPAPA